MFLSCHAARMSFDFGQEVWNTFQHWHSNEEFHDAIISCTDGTHVEAHTYVLASVSSYFQAALIGPMSKWVDGVVTTSLPFSASCVQHFVDCIYQTGTGYFGASVSLYDDVIVAGAPYYHSGGVRYYTNNICR